MRHALALAAAAATLAFAGAAAARCDIRNETSTSFTIESGNVGNQRVGGHTTTSIQHGKIVFKSDDGKAGGGSCTDGQKIKIVKAGDGYAIMPQ